MYNSPQKLTTRLFRQYCDIVYRQCGIKLNDDKRELLHARLSRRLRKLDMCADEYIDLIQSDAQEMDNFVDIVSTNHTFFFRESASFTHIDAGCRDIWCAAASSGEEPYSLAAYCYDRGYRTSILATDISESCLVKGRRGVYPIESSRHIPLPTLKQCFQRGKNQWAAYMRVKPEIKKMVQFERFNLLSDPLPGRVFDAIFCRNVMIYFDSPTKENVVHHLCRALRQGGHFIIGGAESLNGLSHGLTYIAPSVYQKK
ncbi:MAG: protein-glutamate O-methyltransferase CheR [Desulfobacteraceae bacterium]|jgi:chemotaxis protein methyltransferase CheR